MDICYLRNPHYSTTQTMQQWQQIWFFFLLLFVYIHAQMRVTMERIGTNFFYPSLLKQDIKRNQVSSVNTHSIFQACKNGTLAGGERASLIDRLGNVKEPRYLVWALWRWITPKATDPSRFSLRKCDSRLKKDSRDLQVIRQQAKEKRKNPLSLIWHQNKCKLISF